MMLHRARRLRQYAGLHCVPLERLALGLSQRAALLLVILLEFCNERLLLGATWDHGTR